MKTSSITLARLANELCHRFEKLGLDVEGNMYQDDKKLLIKVRQAAEKVLLGK